MNELLCTEQSSPSEALFQRVLVEDSTIISMAKSNAEHVPNNGKGKI